MWKFLDHPELCMSFPQLWWISFPHYPHTGKRVQSYTHVWWISFPHSFGGGDKPKTYPHYLGISYPHFIHIRFSRQKVIPTNTIFTHSATAFIPILSTCGQTVDKLSTIDEVAYLARWEHSRKHRRVSERRVIHFSTDPTTTSNYYNFYYKKNISR